MAVTGHEPSFATDWYREGYYPASEHFADGRRAGRVPLRLSVATAGSPVHDDKIILG
jgi:hypothetical protein